MKPKHIIILMVIAVVSFFVFKKMKDKKKIGSSTPSGGSKWIPERFPMTINMKGEKVRALQKAMNKHDEMQPKLAEDGLFGPKTNAVLLKVGYPMPLTKLGYDTIVNPEKLVKQMEEGFTDGISAWGKDLFNIKS